MEEFYAYTLAPKFLKALEDFGIHLAVLDPVLLRNLMSITEMIIAFLFLFNDRKIASFLALMVIASGSKNVDGKTVNVALVGDVFVYPVAYFQAALAFVILIFPSAYYGGKEDQQ